MRMQLPLPLLLAVAVATLLSLAHSGEIRERAEVALGDGMPPREAELARGFVLGEDERIDPRTVEDFRRSGLSHLLAVSGQNVALLALLAMPVLAALGMPLRTRLVWVLGLIAVYVPLAGAGPTIQRAAIMGGLGVLATLAGRRSSRLYALLLAASATLTIEPRIATDVGWQLSFAAVLGILLLAAPLRRAIAARIGERGWRRALAEAAAMTIAATLATAPLICFHFGTLSTTTLVANLLALPAVAPAMWLGMLAAAAGQLPGAPAEALNAFNAPLLAYIAQVAAWCGRPDWAYVELRLDLAGLLVCYLAIAATALWGLRLLVLALALSVVAVFVLLLAPAGGAGPALPPPEGLRVSVLDVGQGDAILMQPADAPAILVDTGPPGEGLAAQLADAGVERLGAVVITHDQSDHAGGLGEVFDSTAVGHLLCGAIGEVSLSEARAAGVPVSRLAQGGSLRSGRLQLEVLWPPPELLDSRLAVEDPNRLSLVILARWRRFSMLLTGDAEAESTALDSGPVDVLKVAHHGSEDAGLGELLDGARPQLALISVGADNPFGHPTPATLATLAGRGVRILRTDRDGTIVLDLDRGSLRVATGD